MIRTGEPGIAQAEGRCGLPFRQGRCHIFLSLEMGLLVLVQLIIGSLLPQGLCQAVSFILPDSGIGFPHIGPVVVPIPADSLAIHEPVGFLPQVYQDDLLGFYPLLRQFLDQGGQPPGMEGWALPLMQFSTSAR